ncbi:predicted protein [Arabidopsis lyrata subsp. lyrata]|uniref:Predicted protein n=1 Tax=Arabidopsis lyrata subsp. lyrata TaxID=81972 RepID=D7LKP9_ARALL|nr:predicted protein [Arabidopsis lyrata subsp. lyrata]
MAANVMIVESVHMLKKIKAQVVADAGGVPLMVNPALNSALCIQTSRVAYSLVVRRQ